jgi:hypothetical protein
MKINFNFSYKFGWDGINIKLTCKMNRRLAEAKNSSRDIGKSQIEKQEYI